MAEEEYRPRLAVGDNYGVAGAWRFDCQPPADGKQTILKWQGIHYISGLGLDFLVQAPFPLLTLHLPRNGLCQVRGGPRWLRTTASKTSQTAQGGG